MDQAHSNNFDALRLIGALLVLFSHQFALIGLDEPAAWPGTTYGGIGVYLFFTISGYLVCKSWLADPNAHRFIERRFLRIWPGMAVAIVFTAVAAAWHSKVSFTTFASYLRNLVWLRVDDGTAFFPTHPQQNLYGSLWTIPLEVECYFLLMAAGMLFRSWLPRFVTLITGLALLSRFEELWPQAVDLAKAGFHWPVGTPAAYFLAGMVLCMQPQVLMRAWLPILGGAALMLHGNFDDGLLFVLAPTAIFVGSRSWPVLRSAGRYGDLSYGIYLYAWAVQQIGFDVFPKGTSVWPMMAASSACSVALAYFSWHMIERPALALKPSRPREPETLQICEPF